MKNIVNLSVLTAFLLAVVACQPKVELAVSDKPITINLNVKIEHEIRIKVDKELDAVFSKESGLF